MKKLFCMLLSILMLMSVLAGCVEEKDDQAEESGKRNGQTEELSATEKDPTGALMDATEISLADLKERYAGSPAMALAEFASVKRAKYSFDLTVEDMASTPEVRGAGFNGDLYVDTDAKRLFLDGGVVVGDLRIAAKLCFDPEFIGVSVPFLLGGGAFYGMRPYDLTEQARGSFLDNMSDGEISAAFEELDVLIDALMNAGGISIEELVAEMQTLRMDMLKEADLTVKKDTVRFQGRDRDGFVLTGAIEAEVMADYTGKMMELMQDTEIFSGLLDAAEALGQDSAEELNAQIEAALQEIRDSGVTTEYTAYLADGRLTRVEEHIAGNGTATDITIDYYGEDGRSLIMSAVSSDGTNFSMTSTVDDSDGYRHTVTAEADGETIAATAIWGKDGHLELALRDDSQTVLSLTGTLATDGRRGFDFSGDLSLMEGTADAILLDVDLSGAPCELIPTPESTKNIFEMTESELYKIILDAYFALM